MKGTCKPPKVTHERTCTRPADKPVVPNPTYNHVPPITTYRQLAEWWRVDERDGPPTLFNLKPEPETKPGCNHRDMGLFCATCNPTTAGASGEGVENDLHDGK
jgi:hypothetical protein